LMVVTPFALLTAFCPIHCQFGCRIPITIPHEDMASCFVRKKSDFAFVFLMRVDTS
jgi:hypothetical protein